MIVDGKMAGVNSRPDNIRAVCDASLKRLNTEYIDLFYQHRVDPNVPIEDVAGTVKELIQAGKVRHFGMSEAAAQTVRRAHAVQPVAAVQNEYSIWTRDIEAAASWTSVTTRHWTCCHSPLGRGFLTGALSKSGRHRPE
jgi:aryl-alcohol dehydrogenase-like predicted oxidoreductase